MMTPEVQYDRSVAVADKEYRRSNDPLDCLLGDPHRNYYFETGWWFLGVIVQPCRLFCVGDVVFVSLSNGGGERQPVYGFSSKGYAVSRFYLRHRTHWMGRRPYYYQPNTPSGRQPEGGWQRPPASTRGWRAQYFGPGGDAPRGPLRICSDELPGDLAGRRLDDPIVRRYAVETLRAGVVACRVGAGSPALISTDEGGSQ